jgi:hypothetical protein
MVDLSNICSKVIFPRNLHLEWLSPYRIPTFFWWNDSPKIGHHTIPN